MITRGIATFILDYDKCFPIDRPTYDQTIETMKQLVEKMKIDFSEKRRIKAQLE